MNDATETARKEATEMVKTETDWMEKAACILGHFCLYFLAYFTHIKFYMACITFFGPLHMLTNFQCPNTFFGEYL